jgi:hypothetical protein
LTIVIHFQNLTIWRQFPGTAPFEALLPAAHLLNTGVRREIFQTRAGGALR